MKLDIYGGEKTGRWFVHGQYEPGVDTPMAPCPFCGGVDLVLENTHAPMYAVECRGCGAVGPSFGINGVYEVQDAEMARNKAEPVHRKAFREALVAWNARA